MAWSVIGKQVPGHRAAHDAKHHEAQRHFEDQPPGSRQDRVENNDDGQV
jgi:hypothetical protein